MDLLFATLQAQGREEWVSRNLRASLVARSAHNPKARISRFRIQPQHATRKDCPKPLAERLVEPSDLVVVHVVEEMGISVHRLRD